jgi:hypothetical protein
VCNLILAHVIYASGFVFKTRYDNGDPGVPRVGVVPIAVVRIFGCVLRLTDVGPGKDISISLSVPSSMGGLRLERCRVLAW